MLDGLLWIFYEKKRREIANCVSNTPINCNGVVIRAELSLQKKGGTAQARLHSWSLREGKVPGSSSLGIMDFPRNR